MKYILLMYADENRPFTPEEQQTIPAAWGAFRQELEASGVLLSTSGLKGVANSTTLRIRDGKTLTVDGPFAETHEQLGGYVLIDCQDLDEALAWAAKIPTARYGSVEVRPLWSQDV